MPAREVLPEARALFPPIEQRRCGDTFRREEEREYREPVRYRDGVTLSELAATLDVDRVRETRGEVRLRGADHVLSTADTTPFPNRS